MTQSFELVAGDDLGEDLHVVSFRGWERASEGYALDITIEASPSHNCARELTGRRGTLLVRVGRRPRLFHGILSAVTLLGYGRHGADARASYTVRLESRFNMLRHAKRSRVFQDKTVQEVVGEVLGAAHIPAMWRLHHELPKREYITQFEETDEAFVRRITAEAGIFFYFLQPPLPGLGDAIIDDPTAIQALRAALLSSGVSRFVGEVMVFGDGSAAYRTHGELPSVVASMVAGVASRFLDGPVAGAVHQIAEAVAAKIDSGDALIYRPAGDGLVDDHRDVVRDIRVGQSVRSSAAEFRVFDPRRPLAPLVYEHEEGGLDEIRDGLMRGEVPDAGALRDAATEHATAALENARHGEHENHHKPDQIYEHHERFLVPDWEFCEREPERMLGRARRDRELARAETLTPHAACGYRFRVADHPLDWVNREYVAMEVRHEGRSHQRGGGTEDAPVYKNDVVCVPAHVPILPDLPEARVVQTCLTATVIGPEHDTEIHTRDVAEIKIRFHWDRDEHGTCWVRTMQSWSGAGWGAQFMPRVGMEVVVGFDGGDPDKPIVLGCLYNGTHPPPYALPASQTQSGVRTRSTPAAEGAGYNELMFDDAAGRELLRMRAQRDMEAVVVQDERRDVRRDRETRIRRDEALIVERNRDEAVHGDRTLEIEGQSDERFRSVRRVHVVGSDSVHVEGSQEVFVETDASRTTHGTLSETVHGNAQIDVAGSYAMSIGGETPSTSSVFTQGVYQLGASQRLELRADETLVLSCGDSQIVLHPDRIELSSPTVTVSAEDELVAARNGSFVRLTDTTEIGGDSVQLAAESSSLALGSGAELCGSTVSLAQSPSQAEAPETEDSDSDTQELALRILGDDGEGLGDKRFEVRCSGERFEGSTDGDGWIRERVPADATQASITVWTVQYPDRGRRTWTVAIEELESASTLDGARSRLRNLGFATGAGEAMDETTMESLRRFQRLNDVPVTGELDDDTSSALERAHGH